MAAATPKKRSKSEETQATFEDAMQRLSSIVEQLEGGELSLEQSLALFEEGVVLARRSQATLDAAEKRVEQLLAIEADGSPVTQEFDDES
ncbi:MAG: exodeoxyribonuclease VII small subunit [Polyangiaceae bacterium]